MAARVISKGEKGKRKPLKEESVPYQCHANFLHRCKPRSVLPLRKKTPQIFKGWKSTFVYHFQKSRT